MPWPSSWLFRASGSCRFGPPRPLLVLALLAVSAHFAWAEDYAVIVSPDVATADLTTDELRQILYMERRFWSPGQRIELLLSETDLESGSFLLSWFYRTDAAGLRQLILSKVYQREIDLPPKVVAARSTSVYVGRGNGVIAVVPVSELRDAPVKMLSIDGKLPGSDGYALRR